jgi:hypothetical protein
MTEKRYPVAGSSEGKTLKEILSMRRELCRTAIRHAFKHAEMINAFFEGLDFPHDKNYDMITSEYVKKTRDLLFELKTALGMAAEYHPLANFPYNNPTEVKEYKDE